MKSTLAWLLVILLSAFASYHFAYEGGYQSGLEAGLEADRVARMVAASEDLPFPGLTGEVRDVLLLPDPIERVQRLAELLRELEPSALPQVRQAYDSVLFDLGDPELVLLGEWWAKFDPESALDWTRGNWGTRVPRVVHAVIRAWARFDPEAAYAKAGPLNTEDQPFAPYVMAIVQGWSESGMPGLDNFIATKMSGPHQQRATTVNLRGKIRKEGTEATIIWAQSVPNEARLAVNQRVASALAEVDPLRATEFAEKYMEGAYGRFLPRRVATRWAKSNPLAAMEWLSTLPPGSNRDDGVAETFRRWLGSDRRTARAWMKKVVDDPDGRWLEPAASLYALDTVLESPAEAAQWALDHVSDPELSPPAIGNSVRYWLLEDEAAATEWLAESGLPKELQAKILQIPDGFRVNYERFLKKE